MVTHVFYEGSELTCVFSDLYIPSCGQRVHSCCPWGLIALMLEYGAYVVLGFFLMERISSNTVPVFTGHNNPPTSLGIE